MSDPPDDPFRELFYAVDPALPVPAMSLSDWVEQATQIAYAKAKTSSIRPAYPPISDWKNLVAFYNSAKAMGFRVPLPPPTPPIYNGLIRIARQLSNLPDPAVPNTLGMRYWFWHPRHRRLRSPDRGTIWHEAELIAKNFDDIEDVRGCGGIHARLVPFDWLDNREVAELSQTKDWGWGMYDTDYPTIRGIVERFGKYVLGSMGWRAEWVIIRELQSPESIYDDVCRAYPEVKVHKWIDPNPPSDDDDEEEEDY